MAVTYYAHSANAAGQRQPLVEHLQQVANLARTFATPFGGGDIAYLLGLMHDIGKFNPDWQAYLLAAEAGTAARGSGPDHKAAGTQLAIKRMGALALAIQGHHGGLPEASDLKEWLTRKRQTVPDLDRIIDTACATIAGLDGPRITLPADINSAPRLAELYVRMLFSTLVDADFLDTEQHFNTDRSVLRGVEVSLATLGDRFAAHMEQFASAPESAVNAVRRTVLADCMAAAESDPGVFKLAVPTGGGKTLAGMGFALHHARRNGQTRIIVAVPYISITEQTASVYRTVFNRPDEPPVVLEHHSGVSTGSADDDFHPDAVWRRLASENWDAPILVTTTVQLLESLFAARTGKTRKLHRIANSVVIIDEAQTLPARLLTPILDVLGDLTRRYRTSIVLSTATQPAFAALPVFRDVPGHDIVREPAAHFTALRRVRYHYPEGRLQWSEIADLIRDEHQALAILNTRRGALATLSALDDPDALHLSTLLCGAHRRKVLEEVKARLGAGERCRLVSTQVVEAGVDLDFPVVIRALGPLDSIVQAAGRCNREGRLAEMGRVIVVEPAEERLPPDAQYTVGTAEARTILQEGGDLDDPATFDQYFRSVYGILETDRRAIQALRQALDYPATAAAFRMIDDDTESVVVRYGTDAEQARVDRWLRDLADRRGNARLLLRRIQPYVVAIRKREVDRYRQFIEPVIEGIGRWVGEYHPTRGLNPADPPGELIV